MQCAFFEVVRLNQNNYPALKWCHASMNAGQRSAKAGFQAKQAGMLKGIWDVFLPAQNQFYSRAGLYIEFKTGVNKLTKEQVEFKKDLDGQFDFKVCRSWEEGWSAVKEYLGI